MRRVFAEPLTHFLIAGLALFVVGSLYEANSNLHRIVITPSHVAKLANAYALQFGAQPDASTLESLIDSDVHDEILFRQGQAQKLDQDDEIVRRRVVQKMQFLMQDLNAPPEPTDAQLATYYKEHVDHYAAASRTTFSHIFFSSDKAEMRRPRRGRKRC